MTDTTANEAGAIDAGGDGTFSAEQIAQLEAWAIADGHLPADDPPIQASPDAAAQAVDLGPQPDLYGGTVKATDYQFEVPPGMEPMALEEQRAVRAALVAEGIPRDLGNEFARRWNATMRQPIPTDSDLELGMQQAEAQLRQQYGDKTDEVLKLARGEAKRLARRNSMFRAALESTQLGNDPWIAATLANLARARQARK